MTVEGAVHTMAKDRPEPLRLLPVAVVAAAAAVATRIGTRAVVVKTTGMSDPLPNVEANHHR
jgi:hypothetical protein